MIAEILANTLNPDQAIREEAVHQLETLENENFPAYLQYLCEELANENSPSHIRTVAGISLKNTVSAREIARKEQMVQRWIALNDETKQSVKYSILNTLNSDDIKAGSTAAQVIAAIAAIDIPRNQWPDLIQILLENVTKSNKSNLKQASLQTIGYTCELIDPEILASQSNSILTAVVNGALKEEPSQDVRLAAIQALTNSLEFTRANFDQELTITGMKSDDEKVALQAVEFWSTVCDEEIALAVELEEAQISNIKPPICHYFAKAAVNDLVPTLLWLLTKKGMDDEDDEWNISMAAATCLSLLATCVEDDIVAPVLPFVESNINNTDWVYREAAIMAFGSILEGPNPVNLYPLVNQALPLLVNLMKDDITQVKDTTAWTLGRISDVLPDTLKNEATLQSLVTVVTEGLSDTPRVASNCCWCLMNLAEQLEPEDLEVNETYPLSKYFEGIITALLNASQQEQANAEINFRASIYEAMSSLVSHCSKDCLPIVAKLTEVTLQKLDETIMLQNQIVNSDDRLAHHELQANLCSVLTSCIRRLDKEITVMSDNIMTTLLRIISSASKSSTVLEDAFLAVGALSAVIEGEFSKYIESFVPYLNVALQAHEEYQMCSIAVGLVGDICRALNEGVIPYTDEFMNHLLEDLQSSILHRDVKPAILSCFGDIALAINSNFVTYLPIVMVVLKQASSMEASPNDYDMIDYVNQLREGILEAYVGIVQGLKSGNCAGEMAAHVNDIFAFMHNIYNDVEKTEALIRCILGLIGDFADAFPNGELNPLFSEPWISEIIREGKKMRGSISTKEVAKWANQMVKRSLQASSVSY
ncbi:karyopherin Kap95 [Neocallimastix lanati (nom. inval.)]|nr:karyopherin Kap95 [Neocallimastix sp. JGI-2020a]